MRSGSGWRRAELGEEGSWERFGTRLNIRCGLGTRIKWVWLSTDRWVRVNTDWSNTRSCFILAEYAGTFGREVITTGLRCAASDRRARCGVGLLFTDTTDFCLP